MQKPVEDKTSSVYIFDINLGLFMLNACGVVMVRPSPLRATLYLYLCLLMILPFSTFYYSEFLKLSAYDNFASDTLCPNTISFRRVSNPGSTLSD